MTSTYVWCTLTYPINIFCFSEDVRYELETVGMRMFSGAAGGSWYGGGSDCLLLTILPIVPYSRRTC